MDVPSPCQNICVLDEAQVCIGCLRTMEEIAYWGTYTNEQKQAVLDRLEVLDA